MRLRQVIPVLGIFRGFVGGDCASRYSFPYPNDPNESVFFILDENDVLKGYLSFTKVLADNAPSLYAITINGAHVSAGDTELILRGLDEKKEELLGLQQLAGIDKEKQTLSHVVLPNPEWGKLETLCNFPGPRSIYEKYTTNRNVVAIEYLLPQVRKTIEDFRSSYNIAKYDHVANNSSGVLFRPKDRLSKKLSITIKELEDPRISPVPISRESPEADLLAVVEALRTEDEGVGRTATEILREVKPTSDAVLLAIFDIVLLAIFDILNKADPYDRDYRDDLASLLSEIKPKSETFHMAIAEALKDPDSDVRLRVAVTLGEIKSTSETVLMALAEALKDSDSNVRSYAAWALGEIKSTSETVLMALAGALKDSDSNVRSEAARALGEIKSTSETVLMALAEALKDPYVYTRRAAIEAFGKINPKSETIRMALIEAQKDPDERVRQEADNVLRFYGR